VPWEIQRRTSPGFVARPTGGGGGSPDVHVRDLPSVVDLDAIRRGGVRIGVDPLGGASVAYWDAIGEKYGLDLEVVNHTVDPRRASKTRLTWSRL
jgi:phosphoglucomutase